MNFRVYREHDLETMIAMDDRCFAPVFRFGDEVMRSLVDAPASVVIVAETYEGMAGFAIADVEEDEQSKAGYVMTVDVDPTMRGLGLGRELMSRLEAGVSQQGATEMLLHVWVENGAAMRLYEGMGYTRLLRESNFYYPGLDAFLYGKKIRPRP